MQPRLLELAHTICILLAIYPMTITSRGQIKDSAPESLRVSYYFSYTVNAVVQVSKLCYLLRPRNTIRLHFTLFLFRPFMRPVSLNVSRSLIWLLYAGF